jgi:hypothetical protein
MGSGFLAGWFPDVVEPYFPVAVLFLFLWPQAVLLARRLHDLNLSGFWAVLFWGAPLALAYLKLPYIGTVIAQLGAVSIGLIPGTGGPNRYGSDPRGGGATRPATSESPAEKPGLIHTLQGWLGKQSQGEDVATLEVRAIARRFRGKRADRDASLSPQQVRWIERLLDEWQGMFSFVPGRTEGLPYLMSLLKWTEQNPHAEPADLCAQGDWKRIVELRGPVETVLMHSCARCQKTYPRMAISDSFELVDLLCGRCGAVTFKSVHDAERTAACSCGGVARMGCPSCGATEGPVVDEVSPYFYFASHAHYGADAGGTAADR